MSDKSAITSNMSAITSDVSTKALSALSHAAEIHILCIGDAMIDRFMYGAVDRISPEAPIPVFTFERESIMLGGAGNVVRNLLSLGAQSTFISVIGDDLVGKQLLSLVAKEARLVPYLLTEKGRITTEKTRYVSGNQQLLRADNETRAAITQATESQLCNLIESELPKHQAVILSDYGKGVLTDRVIRTTIDTARAHHIPVFVDPKRADMSIYKGATILSPNAKEFQVAIHRENWDESSFIADAAALTSALALDAMLVTRGKDGMSLIEKNGTHTHINASAREVFDVSGAGDTAIATLALAYACGNPSADAARIANLAAGIVVGRLGTALVYQTDLTTALYAEESASLTHKILPLALACDQMSNWKRDGMRVGFTNGCFDIMHAGHVTLLNDAKAQVDKLIVAINTDASVRRLKGDSRPINAEHDRAMLLAALNNVDMVVLFDDDTPMSLLEALKPDILMKGADYTKETVVGAKLVESYGGKIVLLPLKEGYSTTNIIKRASA